MSRIKRQPQEFYRTPEYLAALQSLESQRKVAHGLGNYYVQKHVLEHLHKLFTYLDGHLYWKIRLERGYPVEDTRAGTIYGAHPHKSVRIEVAGRTFSAAGLIYAYHTGLRPNSVRHINGDSLDNRIENLAAKGDPRLRGLPHERYTHLPPQRTTPAPSPRTPDQQKGSLRYFDGIPYRWSLAREFWVPATT